MYDFSKKYIRENFLEFLQEFLPEDLHIKEEKYIDDTKKDLIKNIFKLGKIKSLDDLAILEVEHNSSHDPRTILTKKIFSLSKTETKLGAL